MTLVARMKILRGLQASRQTDKASMEIRISARGEQRGEFAENSLTSETNAV